MIDKVENLEKQLNSIKDKQTVENLKYQRFINFLGLSGLTILLSTFFLTLFNVIDLRYYNEIKFPIYIETFINFILMAFNIVLLLYTSSKNTLKKCIIYSLFYLPIYLITCIIPIEFSVLATIFIPNIFVILASLKNFNFKKLIATNFLVIIFQLLFTYIKVYNFNFEPIIQTSITTFVISIDMFIVYIYIGKVVRKYDRLESLAKHLVYCKRNCFFTFQKKSKNTLDLSDLNGRQKTYFLLMVLGYQIFQLLIVLAIGLINNMIIELIIMLLIFWIGRNILKESWHSNKLWICSSATFMGFYILTKITPPITISIFLIVILTGSFIYLLHYIGVKADRLEELEEENPKLKAMINPEMELRQLCKDVGMSHLLTEICIGHRIHGMSRQEQADKHGYHINTIRKYRNDIANLLKTK